MRRFAAEILGEIGGQANEAVPTLIDMLDVKDSGVRYAVVVALGKIGVLDRKAIYKLTVIKIEDKEERMRRVAEEALNKISQEPLAENG